MCKLVFFKAEGVEVIQTKQAIYNDGIDGVSNMESRGFKELCEIVFLNISKVHNHGLYY